MRSDIEGKLWEKFVFLPATFLSLPTEPFFFPYDRCQKIASDSLGRNIPKLGRGGLGSPFRKAWSRCPRVRARLLIQAQATGLVPEWILEDRAPENLASVGHL